MPRYNQDIDEFQKWLETVPVERLKHLLVDAYWHRRLDDTELVRYFRIEQAGIPMDQVLQRR